MNFMNQKRKVLESPDVCSYNEKFDMGSPYHPMYANSMIDGVGARSGQTSGRYSLKGKNE
jgi:hypothetical protein